MSVQFIAQGVEWTDAMKECVRHRIADPLRKHISHEKFEIYVHLSSHETRGGEIKGKLWMWIELRPPGGDSFELSLREGDDFYNLTNDVSSNMRTQLRKSKLRHRLLS